MGYETVPLSTDSTARSFIMDHNQMGTYQLEQSNRTDGMAAGNARCIRLYLLTMGICKLVRRDNHFILLNTSGTVFSLLLFLLIAGSRAVFRMHYVL